MPEKLRQILIVRLSALGDVLHVLPVVGALREAWPDVAIDWVCETLGADLITGHPDLRDVMPLPRKAWQRRAHRIGEWPSLTREVARFARRLRTRRYDAVLDFQGNLRSRVVGLLARGPRFGHHSTEVKEHAWLFPTRAPSTPSGHVHRVVKNLHVLSAVDPETFAMFDARCDIDELAERYRGRLWNEPTQVTPTDSASNTETIETVVMHPFVSAFGKFKEWPPAAYADLAKRLARTSRRICITCGPGEEERARAICDASNGAACMAPPADSLRALAKVLEQADLVIAADTGPLHMAAVLGTPVIGLFGPKDPVRYGPWTAKRSIVRSGCACSPCTLRRCEHAICMQLITPRRVADTANTMLAMRVDDPDAEQP